MIPAPLPADEEQRLAELRRLEILDTEAEPAFDDLAQLAAEICGCPIALVSLVDGQRQWFKARVGIDAVETSREIAFCAHAILQSGTFEVPDARLDPRFADNPLVAGSPFVTFYAGQPLEASTGHSLGTLCVIDHNPRQLTDAQRDALRTLGHAVVAQLELRVALRDERRHAEAMARQSQLLQEVATIQNRFLRDDVQGALDQLVTALLELTGSSFGFVAARCDDADRTARLELLSVGCTDWTDAERASYRSTDFVGQSIGRTDSPLCRMVSQGEPVLLNEVRDADLAACLPRGYRRPEIVRFAMLPLVVGGVPVGAICLANRPGGYDPVVATTIAPLTATAASLLRHIDTNRRRVDAERMARAEASRLAAVVSHLHAGVLVEDASGQGELVNAQLCSMFGLAPGAAPLRHGECAISTATLAGHFRDSADFLMRTAQAVQRREVLLHEEFELHDGRIVARDYVPITVDGQYRGHVWAYRDVTQRKQAERELLSQSSELATANVELARAARLKDEFLAAMSHELRTPLNVILGNAELLNTPAFGALSAEQVESVGAIEESGRHLLALINDVLDLSKIQAGRIELDRSPVEIEACCVQSQRLVREMAQRKNQQMRLEIDPAIHTIEADSLRLKQILVNLLSNAVKFTPKGGTVGLEVRADAAHDSIRFTVWDTGIGIPAGDLPRLFQPFVQLDTALARQHAGAGLGLALAQRLAGLHGGEITVESSPGRGSRFTLRLPIPAATVAAVPAPQAAHVATGAFAALAPSRPVRVLLVEDNELNIKTVESYLTAKGCHVSVERSGAAAVEHAVAKRPDVILMDIQMPGMDGLEATRLLRANPATASTPIIALTALAMKRDRENCLAAGANDYLSKPFRLKELLGAIKGLLEPKTEEN